MVLRRNFIGRASAASMTCLVKDSLALPAFRSLLNAPPSNGTDADNTKLVKIAIAAGGHGHWAGLTSDYNMPHWRMYFDSLSNSLATGKTPKKSDWYAFGDRWNLSHKAYSATPQGDSYTAALAIARILDLLPNKSLKSER